MLLRPSSQWDGNFCRVTDSNAFVFPLGFEFHYILCYWCFCSQGGVTGEKRLSCSRNNVVLFTINEKSFQHQNHTSEDQFLKGNLITLIYSDYIGTWWYICLGAGFVIKQLQFVLAEWIPSNDPRKSFAHMSLCYQAVLFGMSIS